MCKLENAKYKFSTNKKSTFKFQSKIQNVKVNCYLKCRSKNRVLCVLNTA